MPRSVLRSLRLPTPLDKAATELHPYVAWAQGHVLGAHRMSNTWREIIAAGIAALERQRENDIRRGAYSRDSS